MTNGLASAIKMAGSLDKVASSDGLSSTMTTMRSSSSESQQPQSEVSLFCTGGSDGSEVNNGKQRFRYSRDAFGSGSLPGFA